MTVIPNDMIDQILTEGASSNTLIVLLSKLKEEGAKEKVIQECIKALKIYPNDIYLRQLLAETFYDSDRLSQADDEILKVIDLLGGLVLAYKLQAKIYDRQNRKKETLAAIEVYLAHHPEDNEALEILERLKPVEEATDVEATGEEVKKMVEEPFPKKGPEPIESLDKTPEIEETDAIPDIATPTLAEVYFDQGQLEKAIDIYENVLVQNPEDEKSRQRLDELKSSIELTPPPAEDEPLVNKDRIKKEKILTVLESWLDNIRAMSETSSPA